MKRLYCLVFVTAGSVGIFPPLSAVAVSAPAKSLKITPDQKDLNALIKKNEQALAQARQEREKIAQQLENETKQLEEIATRSSTLKKNQNLAEKKLEKLQKNLSQKQKEKIALTTRYQHLLAKEKSLRQMRLSQFLQHEAQPPLEQFLPATAGDQKEALETLTLSLLAGKTIQQKEALSDKSEDLEKERRRLTAQRESLTQQEKRWQQKEAQIQTTLKTAQKEAAEYQKTIQARDAEIRKRRTLKAELEKKLADLIEAEDLQQRIERQKELAQEKIQRQKGGAAPPKPQQRPTPKLQTNSGFAPLPEKPISRWGTIEDGIANNDIKYPGHPHENVTAPVKALVLFAGEFSGFGNVIILDCGPKTRMVLSGLGSISVAKGNQVKRGQIIGQMPRTPAHSVLSLQLRIKNIPVNPAKYLKK